MTSSVRRALAFALVASLALAAPVLEDAVAVPFAAVAVAALVVTDGAAFELFARPADRREGRLRGLASFALIATALSLGSTLLGLPVAVVVATVLLVAYGNLAEQVAREWSPAAIVSTVAFAGGGAVGAFVGQVVVLGPGLALPDATFLAASGALAAALLRSVLFAHEDPLVLTTVALLLWLFADIGVDTSVTEILLALAIAGAFGYLSWALDTASIPGMLTGIFLGLLTIVLGDYRWFAVLLAFFAIGGMATKFRYEQKKQRGVAEENEGARGSGNVLGNAAVALVALLAFAAHARLPVSGEVFLFAFTGSIATALSDTLSSEIGGVYDRPRLITTLRPVPPGTDGGVTWQGELAGVAGAVLIAVLAVALFDVGGLGAAVVVLAGVGGMTADSLLGATIEGSHVGNQGVNFLATLTGAVLGGWLALAVGTGGLA